MPFHDLTEIFPKMAVERFLLDLEHLCSSR